MPNDSILQLGSSQYFIEQKKLVDKKGQEKTLRPQSLSVLHLLASKPNQMVSKDEIFKAVWNDVVVTDDSLVKCIGDIRRALGDGKHKILSTIPRRGYKLLGEIHALTDSVPDQSDKGIKNDNQLGRFRKKIISAPAVIGLSLLVLSGIVLWLSMGDTTGIASNSAKTSTSARHKDAPSLSVLVNGDRKNSVGEPLDALSQELRVALGYYSTVRLVEGIAADYTLHLDSHGFGKKDSIRQITIELLDSRNASLVLAESYDLADKGDAIANVAIRASAAVASPGLGALARHLRKTTRLKPVEELTPSECYVYGYGCSKCSGEEDDITKRAEACLAHLIKKNPDDARTWALQATIYAHQYWYGNTLPEPQRSTLSLRKHLPQKAIEAANKAEALSSGGDSSVYWGMVEAYMSSCQADKLHAAVQRGLEINPNDPNLLASFGNWLSYSGRWREGAALTRRALEIEPKYYRKWWWMGIAKTHYRFDEDKQAYDAFLKAFNERNWLSHLQLAYTLPYLGREDDARVAVKNLLRLYPGVTLERALEFYKVLCFDDVFLSKMKKALIIAGLPSRGSSDDFNHIRPPTAKTISLNGIETEYMDVGTGEPIVFVHGAVSDYRSWGYYLLPISEKHRYISYSRRYFGTQSWVDQGEHWSSDTFAKDLIAFIEALDIGPVHLVSWSSGAVTANIATARRPDLIKSAMHYEPVSNDVMADAVATGDVTATVAQKSWFSLWDNFFDRLDAGDNERAAQILLENVFEFGVGGFPNEREVTKELFRQNADTVRLRYPPTPRKEKTKITCDYLRKINVPTKIVVGETTHDYWQLMSRKFSSCTPGAKFDVMKGVNHRGVIEDFDTFSSLIIEFVEAHK